MSDNNNRYQGDPAVTITPDGAKMQFIGGQPVMDQGLENASLISAFTKTGWWGNILFKNSENKIGSDYQYQASQPIVDIKSVNNITDALKRAFKWMTDTGVASDVSVTVTNPNSQNIKSQVIITPLGRDSQTLLFLKNGINWISQALNPAHSKFTGSLKQ